MPRAHALTDRAGARLTPRPAPGPTGGRVPAGAFEVEGPLDETALSRALLAFVGRHEVLRCEF
ncbi:hypothetical protein ABT246_34015, partial [Streptomyces sp. NPDC001553]|uniref:hypothetical protein n=1 Tax=Streptomyces sp. NPDC001553 TaxID=3154385 RepID=UPI00332674CE